MEQKQLIDKLREVHNANYLDEFYLKLVSQDWNKLNFKDIAKEFISKTEEFVSQLGEEHWWINKIFILNMSFAKYIKILVDDPKKVEDTIKYFSETYIDKIDKDIDNSKEA